MGDKNHNNRCTRYARSPLPTLENPYVYEILGILLGDGWIGLSGRPRLRKQVCFCGNLKTELNYKNYIRKLIKSAFRVNGYYKERGAHNTYYIIINSSSIFDFFHNHFNFPIGHKTFFDIDKFPKLWSLQKLFIRGIFDTDGSLFFDYDRRYTIPYPVLDITLKNKEVLDWLSRILRSHGFSTIRSGKWIRLKGQKNLRKWFKIISPKNSVHLIKYSNWINTYILGS